MRTTLALLLLVGGISIADEPAPAPIEDPNVTAIRVAIPAAAGMRGEDFMKFARLPRIPTQEDIPDQTLTLKILSLKTSDLTQERREEFEFLADGPPKPAELAQEFSRGSTFIRGKVISLKPITVIHADRITELTATRKGETYTGTVSFKVPDLYQGKVGYTAAQRGERWTVVEWRMPAYGIHVVRDADGRWQDAEPETEAKASE